MSTVKQLQTQIKTLQETNKWFKKQIEPHDCGWMWTTIDGIKYRISVLRSRIRAKIKGKVTPKDKHWSEYN
jgi:hypothetical protein|tara:strand:- start:3490 stop:3702 length:213 start_codon:yes stop_codon:yes gene_type:complete